MIKIDKAIIVEGKYDKIKLKNIVDAPIIETNGFRIFKDREKRELIKMLAEKTGIIVLTDSDNAGRIIRNHIKGIAPGGDITCVLLPAIHGKEKRKKKSSAEGILGVEGIQDKVIIEALEKYAFADKADGKDKVTKADLYNTGLFGRDNSSSQRQNLCKYMSLPGGISVNEFLEVVNLIYGREKFWEAFNNWKQDSSKS